MCNLFANTMPVDAMRRLFDVAPGDDRLGNQPPQPAIFPRDACPVVARGADGARVLTRMHWGFLLPQTSKRTGEPILPKAVNNARDDKLLASPFWADSFARRRCLIPATAFCEARGVKPATWVWFGMVGDGARPPFALAGLWRRFRGRYRDAMVEIDTVSMITTAPNALVRTAHPDRMPCIVAAEHWRDWLDGAPDAAFARIATFPAERMRIVREGLDEKADPSDVDPGGAAPHMQGGAAASRT